MRGERGFTLLEVLVAFTILALVMGALFQVFGDGLRATGRAADYSRGVLVAESRLAALGTADPLAAGVDEGETDDGLRWRTAVEPFALGEDLDPRTLPLDIWQVQVEVSWGEGRDAGRVVLDTLKLEPRR